MSELIKTVLLRLRREIGARLRFRRFRRDFAAFQAMQPPGGLTLRWEDRLPCLVDNTDKSAFDRHYIYHPAWAARILSRTRPERHVDISSALAFSTIVSAFLPVEFYDYRPADVLLEGLTCGKADLTALPFEDGSIASLSCMHTVEHIGLGRYGDPLDPAGDHKAMAELVRVLAPGGSLLVVVPVGKPRIVFNAHRIYSYAQITAPFSGLELIEFALIPENSGEMLLPASPERVDAETYGCGCFWYRKPGV